MKITIVQGAFLPVPPLMGGAVEKVWFLLGKEFARRGHAVVHISRRYAGLPDSEIIDGVEHRRIGGYEAPQSKLLFRLLDLRYALRVIRNLPLADIVVTNSIWLPIVMPKRRYGAIYVHVGRYPKGQTRLYFKAARFQTVSRAVADAIARQDPAGARKTRVIPYPLPNRIAPLDVAESWSAREPTILYVGRIHPEKGIDLLIDAFRIYAGSVRTSWRLRIIGPYEARQGGGGAEYFQRLRERAQPSSDHIDWVGPVFDDRELYSYLCKAKLFAYPSLAEHGESFGLAPLEAMAAGCPPLVSELNCFDDYIERERNGFKFDHRANAPAEILAERLLELTSDDELLCRAGCEAYRVAHDFEPTKIADRYLEDFKSILNDEAKSSDVADSA